MEGVIERRASTINPEGIAGISPEGSLGLGLGARVATVYTSAHGHIHTLK